MNTVHCELPHTRNDLFRLAAILGLLSDPVHCFRIGEARNLTLHAYNDSNAERILNPSRNFPAHAGDLLARKERSND
jgi:hypothetical protein